MLFFFFQAEDGIRDKLVTGVQTCALPISLRVLTNYRRVLAGGQPRITLCVTALHQIAPLTPVRRTPRTNSIKLCGSGSPSRCTKLSFPCSNRRGMPPHAG